MSALGQKRTLHGVRSVRSRSKADILRALGAGAGVQKEAPKKSAEASVLVLRLLLDPVGSTEEDGSTSLGCSGQKPQLSAHLVHKWLRLARL